MRSAIFSCSSAIILRSFSSFECLMKYFGSLAMKFLSKSTTIFSRFTSLPLLCAGVSSTKELQGSERSLLTSLMLEILKHRVLCLQLELSYLEIKSAEVFIPLSAYHIIKLSCALLSLWLFKMPRGLKALMNTRYSLAQNQIVVCFVVSLAIQNAARFESVNEYAVFISA